LNAGIQTEFGVRALPKSVVQRERNLANFCSCLALTSYATQRNNPLSRIGHDGGVYSNYMNFAKVAKVIAFRPDQNHRLGSS
jgi:hypothetical protein